MNNQIPMQNTDITNNNTDATKIKSKRGRKPKLALNENKTQNDIAEISELANTNANNEIKSKPVPGKRGRKPTSKIVTNAEITHFQQTVTECLIAHLPISKAEIDAITGTNNKKPNIVALTNSNLSSNANANANTNINLNANNSGERLLNINFGESNASNQKKTVDKCANCDELNKQIKELEKKNGMFALHNNNKAIININVKIEDIYSGKNLLECNNSICCWWCCHTFDNIPIGLPEKFYDDTFYVTGYFCSFNCALAHNMQLNDHKIWDRHSLLYHMRNIIFAAVYKEDEINNLLSDIVVASPKWLLKMFGGTMLIDDFRKNSIVLKKQYRIIIPNIISITNQFEETTYTLDKIVKHKTIGFNHSNQINTTSNYAISRKQTAKSETNLMSVLNIKCLYNV